jgi:hypothetical protein
MTNAINNFFLFGRRLFLAFAVLSGVISITSTSFGQEVAVFQAAGPNASSIQGTVDQFRAALGGPNATCQTWQTGNQLGRWRRDRATPFDSLNTEASVDNAAGFVQTCGWIGNVWQPELRQHF